MSTRKFLRRLLRRTDAQDMVEYALVAGFLAVTAGATLPTVGGDIEQIFQRVSKTVYAASGGTTSPTAPRQ